MRTPHGWWALLTLCIGACTSMPSVHVPKAVHGRNVGPYAQHEECMRLEPGDRLDYHFVSSEPVRFAIQYRGGGAVLEPIVRDAATEDAAIYPVSEAQVYCLVWEAGAAGARLDYRFVAH